MKTHSWTAIPVGKRAKTSLNWPMCSACGLVRLKNDATEKAVRGPCDPEGELTKGKKR